MSDISIERKLELIRSIRETDSRNRSSLKRHQHILYGQKYDNDFTVGEADMAGMEYPGRKGKISTLGMRSLLAIILFSFYVILDYTGGEWFSVNAGKAFAYIEENSSSNGFAFMQEITYTLNGLIKHPLGTENEK